MSMRIWALDAVMSDIILLVAFEPVGTLRSDRWIG